MRRALPLILIAAVLAVLWVSGLTSLLSWENLARWHTALALWVGGHPVIAPFAYIAVYATIAGLSVPQAAVVTIAGGLLFGTALGGICAVIGASTGATIIFLIARRAVPDRRGPRFEAIRARLQRDGFSYLLVLRFLPIVPFWVVNLAAAVSGIPVRVFAGATFVGIMPATFVFASIGAGVGAVLARGERPDLTILFSWPVLGPLLGLAAISLIPVAWRHWRTADA